MGFQPNSLNLGDLCAMHYTNKTCLQCGKITTNPKFCSLSCSASYSSHHAPRRKRTKQCIDCGELIHSQRKRCASCYKYIKIDWQEITIAEIQARADYQRSAHIRSHARKTYKLHNPKPQCAICGYTNHVEVCHRRPINSFDTNTKVSVINNIDNLIGLCPNHHWEFDNNILKL
jgi:predicted restriction endonuclease